nr:DHHA1 domain-containing protein [Candidatus Sigynarchaeota archaeon]
RDFFSILEDTREIRFVSHENMDPDAIGSIVGMIGFLERTHPSRFSFLAYPPDISKPSRKILDHLHYQVQFVDRLDGSNFLPVLLDIQNIENVLRASGEHAKILQEKSVIIDHHQIEPDLPSRLCYMDNTVQANCEIVHKFYKMKGLVPESPFNSALLAGIMFDSGFLKYARNSTIRAVSELLDTGLDIEEFRQFTSESMDISERIARLKAGIRCNITRIDDVIVVCSEVSTFEASACRGLIGLGADISLVLAENKGEIRISARQTDDCHKNHGVNLATIMRSIAEILGGTGGGHELAAAANGVKNGTEGLKKAIKAIENVIQTKSKLQ